MFNRTNAIPPKGHYEQLLLRDQTRNHFVELCAHKYIGAVDIIFTISVLVPPVMFFIMISTMAS